MTRRDDEWADELHAVFVEMVGLFNRPEPDAALLEAAGIELDRALFPLLSRIGLKAPISVVELADITGKDHSTVSRQVAKLEALGLVARVPSKTDQRVRYLAPSRKGETILGRVRVARRKAIAGFAKDWDRAERERILETLKTLLRIGTGLAERSKQ